jgi:SAM-dependent methyltransferase
VLQCAICGDHKFTFTKVLWPELISEWQLTPYEVDYIDRQQGLICSGCGGNLRSSALARAITRAFGFQGTLAEFVRTPKARELTVLEINEAGSLRPILETLPHHEGLSYPEVDMRTIPRGHGTFDLVVHSDTLEHIDDPVAALSECRRVLKVSGVCCFTAPIVVGRLTRNRQNMPNSYHGSPELKKDDLLVHTEFGSDVWAFVFDAGFTSVKFECVEFPAGLAISALK